MVRGTGLVICLFAATLYVAPAVAHKSTPNSATVGQRDSSKRIVRSYKTRHAFKKANPCPSTGLIHGACPGYVVDHVNPLKRGGSDEPFNMQWQTVADAKDKDRYE
jgi:hypothetical protein